LGRIIEFESHFDRWSPAASRTKWKNQKLPAQGVVYDLGAHLIDQVVVAFGMPKKVTGFISEERNQTESGLEDACTILLHYESMTATIKASPMSATKNQLRFWIRGDRGSFKKLHLDMQEPQLVGGMSIDDPQFGREPIDRSGVLSLVEGGDITEKAHPNVEPPPTYVTFYKELANALAGGGPVPVDAGDALNVIYLIELARKSAANGQTLEVGRAGG